jgi:hypothetical protein
MPDSILFVAYWILGGVTLFLAGVFTGVGLAWFTIVFYPERHVHQYHLPAVREDDPVRVPGSDALVLVRSGTSPSVPRVAPAPVQRAGLLGRKLRRSQHRG